MRLLITDLFFPHGVADDAVLTVKRIDRDAAEQFVSSALYGLSGDRRELVAHVYDGVVCDALNSCGSFGVGFKPRAVESVPELHGGDAVLYVSLKNPARFGDFDGFGGVSPVFLAGHQYDLAKRLDRLLAEARDALVFVLIEVECIVERDAAARRVGAGADNHEPAELGEVA